MNRSVTCLAGLALALLCLAPGGALAAEPPSLFEEVTADSGLEGLRGQYLVWSDYDDDGHPDLLVHGRKLMRNSGPPGYTFRDATEAAGLKGLAGQGSFVDVDNDGDLDLATTAGQLWLNRGDGTFRAAGKPWRFAPPERCSAMAWADLNGDGWLDAYCAVREDWNKGKPRYFPHKILLNRKGEKFKDATPGFLKKLGRYGRSVSACDYDLDGDVDLYVGNYRLQANFFLRNRGKGRFREVARDNGTAGKERTLPDPNTGKVHGPYWGHTIGSAWADFDNDGLFDLFVANLVHKFVGYHPRIGNDIRGRICDDSKVYRNRGGPAFTFEDVRVARSIPLRPAGDRSVFKGDELWCNVVCGDYDNDGWVDAYVPQIYDLPYAHSLLFRNVEGAAFKDVSRELGLRVVNTYGAAWADYDSDGTLDLAVLGQDKANPRDQKPKAYRGRLHLFRNRGARGRWIRFDLKAATGNRLAVGAQVFVRAGSLYMARQVEIGTGSHGQQNDPRLHFGLGAETSVQAVYVRWGRGISQLVMPRPRPGTTHVLVEPGRPSFSVKGLDADREGNGRVRLCVTLSGRVDPAFLWDLDGDGRFDRKTDHHTIRANLPAGREAYVRVLVLDRDTGVGRERAKRFRVE